MNAIAIVQARLGSTRFPRKVLADLNGQSVIQHVVERAWAIRGVHLVVVACPLSDVDEIRVALPYTTIRGWAGDEDDVLGRFVGVAYWYALATGHHTTIGMRDEWRRPWLRLTADNPFLSPQLAERVLACVQGGAQYASTRYDGGDSGWPNGLDVEAFTTDALMLAHREATTPEREHVTSAMRRLLPVSQQEAVPCPQGFDWPEGCKLSIDMPADLDYARTVMGRIATPPPMGYHWLATREAAFGREAYLVDTNERVLTGAQYNSTVVEAEGCGQHPTASNQCQASQEGAQHG